MTKISTRLRSYSIINVNNGIAVLTTDDSTFYIKEKKLLNLLKEIDSSKLPTRIFIDFESDNTENNIITDLLIFDNNVFNMEKNLFEFTPSNSLPRIILNSLDLFSKRIEILEERLLKTNQKVDDISKSFDSSLKSIFDKLLVITQLLKVN